MFAKLFVATAILAASQSAFAHCTRKVTVKEGDICDSISAENSVSTYQFAAINYDIIDAECSNLIPGQEYCLGYENEDCSTTYVVKADDTCEGIAEASGVNTTMIHLNNPQIENDCSNIYIGEVLCVAETVILPPPPPVMPAKDIPTTATPAQPSPTPHEEPTSHEEPVIHEELATHEEEPQEEEPQEEECEEEEQEDYQEDYQEVDDDDEDLPYCDEVDL